MPRNFLSELVGVIGFPVAENPTQVMMEAAFEQLGLDWRYLTMEVRPENLGAAVRGAKALQFRGLNCTLPHKVSVLNHLDRLSPAAQTIGAVNCVAIVDGALLGDNTDGKGFLQSVAAVRPVQGAHAVILGAGGAARAIAVELALAGASRLTVVNRDAGRGQALADLLRERTPVPASYEKWEADYQVPAEADLLVNATSIGLFPDVDARVPVDLGAIGPDLLVCDVIPNPPRTRFLCEAEARGCATLDGLGMLVNQGVIGIRLWTGLDPDPALMRRALERVLT